MSEKKISFGFKKSTKSAYLPSAATVANNKKDNIELIQCVEGQTIKIIGEQIKAEEKLVIPVLNNTKTSASLAALKTLRETLGLNEDVPQPPSQPQNNDEIKPTADASTLEQRAALEILNEMKDSQNSTKIDNNLVLSVKSADELPLNGAEEATLDDYNKIPISQYGLAMLRGMGWKEPSETEKKTKLDVGPELRPKGMGLGADKMIKPKPLLVPPAKDEVLTIKKSASVRILLGKYKDMYGQIESLDDHAGRLLIKLALGGTQEWFNEFMVQPVSKEEYTQYAKVLNSAKYEEYKKKQQSENVTTKTEQIESSSKNHMYSPMPTSKYDKNDSDSSQKEKEYHRSTRDDKTYDQRKNQSPNQSHHSKYSKHHGKSSRSRYRSTSSESDLDDRNNYSRHNSRKDYASSDDDRNTHKKYSSSMKKSKKHTSKNRSPIHNHSEKYNKKKTKKSKRQKSRSRS